MRSKLTAMYVLGTLIVLAFFTLLALLIFKEIPTSNNDVLNLSIGALISGFATVVNYFYGSSAGSAAKNELLSQKRPEGS
jgi:drug/metabolite transporter (DMT)-like permease